MGPEPIKMERNVETDDNKREADVAFACLCFVACYAFGVVSFMLIAMYGG